MRERIGFCDNDILVFPILNLLDLKSGLTGLEVFALKYYLMGISGKTAFTFFFTVLFSEKLSRHKAS